MAIYQTATYQVRSQAVDNVKQAIEEFVRYIQAYEPGTRLYVAWQNKDDPTRFIHHFIFEGEADRMVHRQSEATKRFVSIYSPEPVGGEVVFAEYNLIATNQL